MRSSVLLLALLVSPFGAVGAQELALSERGPRFLLASFGRDAVEIDPAKAPVFQRRVSLDLEDGTVGAALAEVGRQAGVRLVYSRDVLDPGAPARIKAEGITVAGALTEILLDAGVDVVLSDFNRLTLGPRKLPPPVQEGAIVGRVTDAETGQGLEAAEVWLEGTRFRVSTGPDGQYRIGEAGVGSYTISARRIGYARRTQSVTVVADQEATVDFALEASPTKLDELVTVTPGGMQTEVRALPTPVSVITAEDIEHRRPRTLIDVIREAVPTAVVFDNPSRPDATFFSVRGASSLSGLGSMKVFVDGLETVAFNSPVDPDNIERIEVVRGPQAATLYGSDAASGVVQIFTKRGDAGLNRPQVDVQAALGLAQTPYDGAGGVLRQQYAGSARGGGGDVGYNLGGAYTHLADWLPNGEPSRQSSPNAYGAIRYSRGIVSMDLHGRYFRNKLATGVNPLLLTAGFVPFSRPFYEDQNLTNEIFGARFAVAPTNWWRNQVTLGVDRSTVANVQTQRRFTTPDDTLFNIFTINNRKVSLYYNTAVTGMLSADVAGTLTAGIDHFDTDASTFGTSQAVATTGTIVTEPPGSLSESRATIANTGYFAQTEVGWRDAVFLTAGVRAEDNSTFGQGLGTPVLPRLGVSAVQQFGQVEVKIRGAYGRAIRAPAPGQSFGGVGPSQITLANPLLAPERQRGWDAGIDLVLDDRASLSISGYDQTAEDLIVFVQLASSGTPTAQFQNVGQVANSGLEVEGKFGLRGWELRAQYGYARSRIEDLGPGVSPSADLQVGARPLGLPAHTAGASLRLEPRAGTTVTAGLTYVGSLRQLDVVALIRCFGGTGACPESFLTTGSTRDFLADYPAFAKLNAGVTQRITPQLEGFVSVDNLTNNLAYEGTNTGGVIGRITMAGVQVSF